MKISHKYLAAVIPLLFACNNGEASEDQAIAQDATTEVISSSEELSELSLTTEVVAEATAEAALNVTEEDLAAAIGAKLQAVVDVAQNGCEAQIAVNGAVVSAVWGNAAGCTFGDGSQAVTLSGQSTITVDIPQAGAFDFIIDSAAQVANTTIDANTTLSVNSINQSISIDRSLTATHEAETFAISYSGDAVFSAGTLVLNLERQVELSGDTLRQQTWTDLTLRSGVLLPISGAVSFDSFRGRSADISFANDGGDLVTVTAALDGRRADASFVFTFNVAENTLVLEE